MDTQLQPVQAQSCHHHTALFWLLPRRKTLLAASTGSQPFLFIFFFASKSPSRTGSGAEPGRTGAPSLHRAGAAGLRRTEAGHSEGPGPRPRPGEGFAPTPRRQRRARALRGAGSGRGGQRGIPPSPPRPALPRSPAAGGHSPAGGGHHLGPPPLGAAAGSEHLRAEQGGPRPRESAAQLSRDFPQPPAPARSPLSANRKACRCAVSNGKFGSVRAWRSGSGQ